MAPAHLHAADDPFPAGMAKGTFSNKSESATLTHAAAFVDEKEEARPIILILSDGKLAIEEWTRECDLIRASSKLEFTGVVIF